MDKADENYVERLCNSVAKKMVEVIENITIEDVNAYKVGYNKAIDEFAEKMKWEYENSIGVPKREIDFAIAVVELVAEQLKGGSNEER